MKKIAVYETQLGYIQIGYDTNMPNVLTHLSLLKEKPMEFGKKDEFTDIVYEEIIQYFKRKRKTFDFKYELKGTDFQIKVWQALCDIPYGETRTYKDIAIAIGNDKACRAVGMANNQNPIAIVVPCHRVIGSNGKLVGYASGLEIKSFLLNLENKNITK